jgi:hypothetical protein
MGLHFCKVASLRYDAPSKIFLTEHDSYESESKRGYEAWDNKPLPFPEPSRLPLGIIPGSGEQRNK